MITITLTRNKPVRSNSKAVRGHMSIPFDTPIIVNSLENADYLIPAGTYPLERTWSPKFKKLLPLILEVPDREGSRIIGVPANFNLWGERRTRETYPYDGVVRQSEGFERDGCILTDMYGMSCINVLFNQIEKKASEYETEPEKVCLTVIDPA